MLDIRFYSNCLPDAVVDVDVKVVVENTSDPVVALSVELKSVVVDVVDVDVDVDAHSTGTLTPTEIF